MSVQVTKLEEKHMVRLTIEVSAEAFEQAMQEAYNKEKKNFSLPGFRKGKVPRNMIEKMYGPGVFYEDAANSLIPQAYSDAVKECGEDVVSRPEIDVTQIEKGKSFIFTADVAVKPEVTLGEYKGVEVTKIDIVVTDEEITAEIDRERENNARTIVVEDRPIADGDTAIIDYEGFCDGVPFDGGQADNHALVIGSGSFIPGFEDQLIGKTAGSQVDVEVTFPEEYHAPDLAGKDAIFKVTIHEIKTKEIPEFDEDFVQDVSEYDTIEEYTDSVKAKLAERKAADVKRNQQEEALGKIVAASEMDIPEPMIVTQCENMVNQFAQQMAQQGLPMEQYLQFSGTTIEDLKEQVRPEAMDRIANDLVLEAIAKAEGIAITEEDVDAEIASMAAMYRMDAEQLKGYLTEDDQENMKLDLASRKALALIADNMVPVEAPAVADEESDEAAEETVEE